LGRDPHPRYQAHLEIVAIFATASYRLRVETTAWQADEIRMRILFAHL
jgi:hypothetical protein